MESVITIELVGWLIGLFGTVFGIYHYLTRPQIKLDKDQALAKQRTEREDVALAQQLNWEKEANAKRFHDMQETIEKSMTLAQNHIHTVDGKVDGLREEVVKLSKDVVKLATIIEERIPKK